MSSNIGKEFKRYAELDHNVSEEETQHHIQGMTPNIVEERSMNVTAIDVFSRLMMDRIIFLGKPITADVGNVVQAQLLFLESTEAEKDINIYVNSPGGSVYAGLGIYDTMQYIKPNITTICTGLAASMGAILLAGGTDGQRQALPHARIMIHQPLGGINYGQASDIEITANEILKIKEELYQILHKHTNTSIEQIRKDADRDHWMKADEAEEYGIIDKVIRRNDDE